MIYVTHDQIEAMTLADRIAIMKSGAIQQLGTPDEIYNRPVNKYVAAFIGSPSMNFLEGRLENGVVKVGELLFPMQDYPFVNATAQGDVWIGIRPEHVLTGPAAEAAPFRTEIEVDIVEPTGADTLILSTLAGEPFRIRMDGQARVSAGDRIAIGVNPAAASLFDKASEQRL